jgi:L-iditol 2-dehydrogenase
MALMNAAMFYGPGDVRFERTEVPTPGPGEVLVRVGATLTCGTDIKTYRRGHPVMITRVPSTFGHEYSGTVVEVGEGVTRFQPGMRVVSCNAAPCQECFYCKKNRQNLCENLVILNGSYAEYIVVPSALVKYQLLEFPDHLSFEEAALAEPLGTAVRAIEATEIQQGDAVAILGSGPLGLMISRLAHLQGGRVILLGKGEERLEVAREFGVNEIVDITHVEDKVRAARELTPGGRGADIVIEAVGLPEAWQEAIEIAGKAATVTFFGGCKSGTSITLDTKLMHYSELKLVGVFHQTPNHFRRSLNLLSSRLVDGRKFVKETLPLSQLLEAFDRVKALEAIKYAIDPTTM